MTLTTLVATDYYADPKKVLNELNYAFLGKEADKVRVETDPRSLYTGNVPDQGLKAIVRVYHNNGKDFVWEELHHGSRINSVDILAQYKEDAAGSPENTKLIFWFDTGWSFGERSFSAGDLHMTYVSKVYDIFVKPNGAKMKWRDEYSGKWFDGLDNLSKLSKNSAESVKMFEIIKESLSKDGFSF